MSTSAPDFSASIKQKSLFKPLDKIASISKPTNWKQVAIITGILALAFLAIGATVLASPASFAFLGISASALSISGFSAIGLGAGLGLTAIIAALKARKESHVLSEESDDSEMVKPEIEDKISPDQASVFGMSNPNDDLDGAHL